MNKFNWLFIVAFLLFLNPNLIFCQDKEPKLLVSIVPHYLITNCIRMEIDRKVNNKFTWMIFTPELYYGKINRNNTANVNDLLIDNLSQNGDLLSGIGFGINCRNYFNNKHVGEGAYFSFGVSTRYLNIGINTFVPESFIDNGITKIHYVAQKANIGIISGDLNFMNIGIQGELVDHLYTDIYIGLGLRYSYNSIGEESGKRVFERYFWDYGYNGVHLLGGIRLGVDLTK